MATDRTTDELKAGRAVILGLKGRVRKVIAQQDLEFLIYLEDRKAEEKMRREQEELRLQYARDEEARKTKEEAKAREAEEMREMHIQAAMNT